MPNDPATTEPCTAKNHDDQFYVMNGLMLHFTNGIPPRIATLAEASMWDEIVRLRVELDAYKQNLADAQDDIAEEAAATSLLRAQLDVALARQKAHHRRAQKAEAALAKAQRKPVDMWESPERQKEAAERERAMDAIAASFAKAGRR